MNEYTHSAHLKIIIKLSERDNEKIPLCFLRQLRVQMLQFIQFRNRELPFECVVQSG